MTIENEYGSIHINNDVIATLASASAMECYGLVGMAAKSPGSGIVNLLKRENSSKGIAIKYEDHAVIIDVFVIIQFGTKISVVAENIIKKVKYNVERLAGVHVKKVNLNIESVRVL